MFRTSEVVYDDLIWAEAPRWHDGVLWISDTQGSHLVEIAGSEVTVHDVSPPVNGTAPAPDGTLVGARMAGARVDRFDGQEWTVLADLGAAVGAGRLGDLTRRSDGTVYVDDLGSQDHSGKVEATGRLIKVDPQGNAAVAADGMTFPNGLALIEGETTLVVAETFAGRLRACTVAADGGLSAPRPWADLGAALGEEYKPDGIWAAADGSVWVGTTTGEAFVRVREGEVLERIDVDGFAIACCLDDDGAFYGTVAVSTDPEKTVFEAVAEKQLRAWVERHPRADA
ncbi:MAG: SMP-30/gluconolactonase/LRE family protein [Actinobacteria bacterium]|nr:SMP-30/gluconolactonase/LRE family protein [Actinomycetota bacterium]